MSGLVSETQSMLAKASATIKAKARRANEIVSSLSARSARRADAAAEGKRGSGVRGSIRTHLNATMIVIAMLAGSIGILSATTDLSSAVVAAGSLVVETNVKKIQHPTGGIVRELLVRDGDHVRAGDLLIRLDPTEAQANLAGLTKDVWELTAREARLKAERDDSESIVFPPQLIQAAEDLEIGRIVSGESRLFDLRRDANRGEKAQLRERIAQLAEQITGLTEQISAKKEEIALIEKELGGVRDLWAKNLVPITRVMALERDAARLRGERGLLIAATAQTKGKISETELQILQLDQNLRRDVAKELADIRAKLSELVEKKVTATEQLQRIDMRTPQSGYVHQLSVHTKGGVIGPGEQVMLIVPEADALVVEVKVPPNDIDQVQLGHPATLRFTSFNQRSTPELDGTVTRIAADTIKNDGAPYYPLRIAINSGEIDRLAGLKLVPGMPVEAFITTAGRSLLSYFLKPLRDQTRRAFREK